MIFISHQQARHFWPTGINRNSMVRHIRTDFLTICQECASGGSGSANSKYQHVANTGIHRHPCTLWCVDTTAGPQMSEFAYLHIKSRNDLHSWFESLACSNCGPEAWSRPKSRYGILQHNVLTLTTHTPLVERCTFTPLIKGVGPKQQ